MSRSPLANSLCLSYRTGLTANVDLEPLCQLIFLAQTDTDAQIRTLSTIRNCIQALLACHSRYVVAYHNRELVGVIVGCDCQQLYNNRDNLPQDTFYVSDTAVHPAYRRLGIATRIRATLVHFIRHQYSYVFSHTRFSSRTFYLLKKLGYIIHSEYRGKAGMLKQYANNPQYSAYRAYSGKQLPPIR